MNIALILAGGVDPRFKMEVPKQFVNVFERPLIVYTLEIFQKHPEIDAIVVSCLDGWQEMVRSYGKQFGINKLKWIVKGGRTGQESCYQGVNLLKEVCKEDDIIIVHDAIRPFVSNSIISDSIKVCRNMGMGVAAVYTMDTIMKSEDLLVGEESINRYEIMRVQTPQSYKFGLLEKAHSDAVEKNVIGYWDTCSMMSKLGYKIYFSKGSDINLKINRVEDVAMFKALYSMREEIDDI